MVLAYQIGPETELTLDLTKIKVQARKQNRRKIYKQQRTPFYGTSDHQPQQCRVNDIPERNLPNGKSIGGKIQET